MDKLNLIDFDKYTITEDGKILSKYWNRYITGSIDRRGYVQISMKSKNGDMLNVLFHRVIWYYFNGEIPDGFQVNHIDENKTNNALSNLNLLTPKDNINWGSRNERSRKSNSIFWKGKKKPIEQVEKMRLTKSIPIIQYDLKTNEPIKEWQSSKDVEKQLGFDRGAIRRVCRGLHKQAYGYGWKDLCP